MRSIHVLDNLLVNKIAAGEVIERPASVVKELLENAIDAGATHLTIELEDGGKRLIRVVDDGKGITRDDLPLAVAAHATSKLSREEDLAAIGTLGFRGEALASIGAISQLRLTSRPIGSDEGATIAVAGVQIDGPEVTGCAPGTTVEVRQLFFNVPARQKFLRTATTEFGHIGEQVTRVALAHQAVGITVTHNGRETLRLGPADPGLEPARERIGALFSPEMAEGLIPIRRDERGVRIEGLLALPDRARSSGKWQYVLLNGRYIRDRFVQHAIKEAHRGLVDAHRHPILFLFLTVDPATVDVNVHPTKIEVRWENSGLIHSQTLAVLRDTLLSRDLTAALSTATASNDGETPPTDREALRRQMADYSKNLEPPAPAQHAPAGAPPPPRAGEVAAAIPASVTGIVPGGGVRTAADHAALYQPVPAAPPRGDASVLSAPEAVPDAAEPAAATTPRRAVQLHNTYLVAETDDGLIIVDQHALHERVLYNEFRRRIADGPLESQRLLLPETVQAAPHQMALLETHRALLERLGFDAAPFGRNAVAVHAAPSLLPDATVREFFADLLDKLGDLPAGPEPEEVLHAVLDMMACKAAVKAGDPLTPEEIESLLRRGASVEKASNCPHGRPTTLRLTVRDLEKQFHRV